MATTENEFSSRLAELSHKLEVSQERSQKFQDELSATKVQLSAALTAKKIPNKHNEKLTTQAHADQKVLKALGPVKEQLSTVQRHVSSMESERAKHYGQITEQLKQTREIDQHLLTTTRSLESTMKNTKERGRWGELQLKRVVESAGMLNHVDFQEQVTLENGQRPDMVISLPGQKHLIVDSKVPLDAYQTARQNI